MYVNAAAGDTRAGVARAASAGVKKGILKVGVEKLLEWLFATKK